MVNVFENVKFVADEHSLSKNAWFIIFLNN